VVAVAEEGLRVRRDELRVEEGDDGDLVVATQGGEDRVDLRVGERRHDVTRPVLGEGLELAGGGVLDGLQSELLTEPAHGLLVNLRTESGGRLGGGEDGHLPYVSFVTHVINYTTNVS